LSCSAAVSAATFWKFDHYQLRDWCRDLRRNFPILGGDRHSYEKFYLLWRLSFMFGRKYAHLSFSYGALPQSPRKTLETLFETLGIEQDPAPYIGRVEPTTIGRWREYADDSWFKIKETTCQQTLQQYIAHTDSL
jgi:hypothetical protein